MKWKRIPQPPLPEEPNGEWFADAEPPVGEDPHPYTSYYKGETSGLMYRLHQAWNGTSAWFKEDV